MCCLIGSNLLKDGSTSVPVICSLLAKTVGAIDLDLLLRLQSCLNQQIVCLPERSWIHLKVKL